jgi:hypothetical protein
MATMSRTDLERLLVRAMFAAKPCPDGERGLACPRCMAKEAVDQMTIVATFHFISDEPSQATGRESVTLPQTT